MGNENEGILILLKVTPEPLDMLLIQVVGGLVQQEDIRFLQQQLSKQDLCPLPAGQLCHVLIHADVRKAQSPSHLLHLCVDGIEIMGHQKFLDRSQLLHHGFHLTLRRFSQTVADLIHLLLHLKQERKCAFQRLADCHALFQDGMLVQISHAHTLGPLYLSLIRLQFPCDNVHEGGFSLTVGSYQPDMLPL